MDYRASVERQWWLLHGGLRGEASLFGKAKIGVQVVNGHQARKRKIGLQRGREVYRLAQKKDIRKKASKMIFFIDGKGKV